MTQSSPSVRRTLCNRDCPDVCGILATVEDGRVIRLQGDPNHPVTRGFLCHRTNHFLKTQYAKDRLKTPLLRRNGELTPVDWDTALGVAAERLVAIRDESGPAAIFHYRSGGSLGLLKYITDYFFEQFGPVTMKRGDICSGASEAAQELDFGVSDSNDLFDLLNARHILLWGKNVATSSPHTLRVLKDAKDRGTQLVLVDPVQHQTARMCHAVFQPRPGGDFALAMAIARVIFDEQWCDPDAAEYCDNLNEFRSLVYSQSRDQWCTQADVAVEVARDLATRLHNGPTTILVGWGMGRRVNGGAITRALDALAAITGNVGVPGAGVSFYFRRQGAFDTSWIRGRAAAPRTICEPLFGPEVLAASDPPIRAVWITAGNPVVMLPQSHTVAKALQSRDFVVVVDSFLTDTAQLADLVFPTTTLLEDDDLLGAYGHHYLGVSTPIVDPPEGVRSDLAIIQGVAERVGLGSTLAGSAKHWKGRFVGARLRQHGIDMDRLAKGVVANPLVPKILFSDRIFPTRSGKANLLAELPVMPAPPDPDYPLFLMSLSTPKAQSSQWATPQQGLAVVTVHPSAANGIPDGGKGHLASRISVVEVIVRHDSTQRTDVLLMPKGGHYSKGRCPNALIAARTTDMGEGAALYDERVRLTPP